MTHVWRKTTDGVTETSYIEEENGIVTMTYELLIVMLTDLGWTEGES